ncbi:hypothetical protein O181_019416 [Austropuccinia psidii MF-1]|uniref:Wax synthase domain-containing protein n=1 Tax=Austropuccinia psidii MF-1 TaxID=1389203 RepID=A0A9Q3C744_9BASI|nr:hypothetical protein [Austropuccinia psidii MF-1]
MQLPELPCPKSTLGMYLGLPLLLLQLILLHPYYQLKYPGSKLIRKAVLPIQLYMAFATLPKRIIEPRSAYLHFNFSLVSLTAFHFICLSIICAFHQGAVYKTEAEIFETRNSIEKNDSRKSLSDKEITTTEELSKQNLQKKSESVNSKSQALKRPSIGEQTRWIISFLMSPRGLKCVWAPPENVVPLLPKMSAKQFLIETYIWAVVMHIWFQFICAFGVASVSNPRGAYGVLTDDFGLPSWKILEFYSPYLLTIVLGGGAYSGFALVGCLFNLIEVSLIHLWRAILPEGNQFRPEPFDSTYYPPLFNEPFIRTSLAEFWGKGWQAVFRHHFLFCGALPMYKIFGRFGKTAGKLAGVMGAMMLSAAMHEFCLVSVSKPDPSYSSTKMFLIQGVGIVLEAIFQKVTGHRVEGILGWLWTFSFVILNGRPMVDAWKRNGLGNSEGAVNFKQWGLIQYFVPFGAFITDNVYYYLKDKLMFK